ncbi:ABC transporter ATP-binding protein [Derxia gummosa]|uniref:ABC transporter ATP-binding protein n=1 Tax=Derxia gummosa DSM 723 TaxID=1121388 RepID=A0A8B6XBQ5_9BURK|nr:ABC transporter ATP-binding protein [Derxia gummosa]
MAARAGIDAIAAAPVGAGLQAFAPDARPVGPALVSLRGVGFGYGGRRVLDGIDLELRRGEVLALLGANGSGKSTLLRLMLGARRAETGSVLLLGRRIHDWSQGEIARRLAYVPQSHVPPFPYTVADIVALGRLPWRGRFGAAGVDDRRIVAAAIERLGIGHLAARRYTEISGGERQLALIARAIAQQAGAIVMDEPATALDYGHQWRMLDLVREFAAEGHSFVMSTHTPEHALHAATRVALLAGGRIVADGAPRAVVTPEAIERLYGIRVEAVEAPDRRRAAFFPLAAQ